MKLDGFKELLVKKTEDEFIQTLVKHISNDILVDYIYEALEKMARSGHKGTTANAAMHDFVDNIDPGTHPDMIRDSLGHHVSRYKAALKSGNSDMANHHASKALKTMNLVDRMQKHSDGALTMSYTPIQPWERHGKSKQFTADDGPVKSGKKKVGQYTTDTKGLNYKGKNFDFLQQAPHSSYIKEIKRTGETGAYPFEKIRINGKHITVDDNVDLHDGSGSHEFDHHPIHKFSNIKVGDWNEGHDDDYLKAHDDYHDEGGHMSKWEARHDKMQAEDPEGHSKRGLEVSTPVHDKVDPIDLEADTAIKQKDSKPASDKIEKLKSMFSKEELDGMNFTPEQKKLLGL